MHRYEDNGRTMHQKMSSVLHFLVPLEPLQEERENRKEKREHGSGRLHVFRIDFVCVIMILSRLNLTFEGTINAQRTWW